MKPIGLEMAKSRVNMMNRVYKIDENQRELIKKRVKEQKALEESKPAGSMRVRMGDRLYEVDLKSGNRVLIGIYIKTSSGKEVLQPVGGLDSIVLTEQADQAKDFGFGKDDKKTFSDFLSDNYNKNAQISKKNK